MHEIQINDLTMTPSPEKTEPKWPRFQPGLNCFVEKPVYEYSPTLNCCQKQCLLYKITSSFEPTRSSLYFLDKRDEVKDFFDVVFGLAFPRLP